MVILNGRYAGRKAIIVKSNYENVKDRKYPHCIVIGLSKGPRKATKKSLKKFEEKVKALEAKPESADAVQKLKTLGVFIKTYNMAHLLVTRYSVKEDFGISKGLEKLESIEAQMKETKTKINKLTVEKKTSELEPLQKSLGEEKDKYKTATREMKATVGKEMFERFMEGFVRTNDEKENERKEHTEFLFKKLNF